MFIFAIQNYSIMRTAQLSMESIWLMLSSLTPEDKVWLGNKLLKDADTSDNTHNPQHYFELLYRLDNNWDGYGAPKISVTAIDNCKHVINDISQDTYQYLEILPTEIGGVQVIYKPNAADRLSCNIGDNELSYYIKKEGKQTFFSPFLECNNLNFKKVSDSINNFANA